MNKEELERIADNIQMQMILEQNTGYRNEYSQTLKDKIDLYNEVIRLQEIKEKAIEYIEKETEGRDANPIEGSWLYDLLKVKEILKGEKE